MIVEKEHTISYAPLSCPQAAAVEESDRIVAKQRAIPESPVLPINDGRNACPFLSLGIIDSLEMISHKVVNEHAMTGVNNLMPVLQERVSLIVNRLRNVTEMYAVYEAYSILNPHNLLERSCNFIDKCINNYKIYSHEFQFESKKSVARNKRQSCCIKAVSIIDFSCWYLYFCDVRCTNGEIIVLETHPIQEELHGNGNELLVVSKTIDEMFAWIFKRASRASVVVSCTPFLYYAILCK